VVDEPFDFQGLRRAVPETPPAREPVAAACPEILRVRTEYSGSDAAGADRLAERLAADAIPHARAAVGRGHEQPAAVGREARRPGDAGEFDLPYQQAGLRAPDAQRAVGGGREHPAAV